MYIDFFFSVLVVVEPRRAFHGVLGYGSVAFWVEELVCCGAGPGEGKTSTRGINRKLGLFSLWERRHWRDLQSFFQCLEGLQESCRGTLGKGQGAVASHLQRAGLDGIMGRNCSL